LSSNICYFFDVYSGILAILRYYLQRVMFIYASVFIFNRHNFVVIVAYNYDKGQI